MFKYLYTFLLFSIMLIQSLSADSEQSNTIFRKGLFIQAGYDYGVLGGNFEPSREETYIREDTSLLGFGTSDQDADTRNKKVKYTPKNNMLIPSITIGYEWESIGFSISYSTQSMKFKNDLKKTDLDQSRETINFDSKTYLADIYYKFNNASNLTPFVGVMAGYSKHKINANLNMRAPDQWSPTLLAAGLWSIDSITSLQELSQISKELDNTVDLTADSTTTTFGFKGGAQYNFTKRFSVVVDVALIYMIGKIENASEASFSRTYTDITGDTEVLGTMKMSGNVGIPLATLGVKLKYYIW